MGTWWKTKEFWFAVLTVVVGVAVALGFGEYVPDPGTAQLLSAIVTLVVGIINLILGKRAAVRASLK